MARPAAALPLALLLELWPFPAGGVPPPAGAAAAAAPAAVAGGARGGPRVCEVTFRNVAGSFMVGGEEEGRAPGAKPDAEVRIYAAPSGRGLGLVLSEEDAAAEWEAILSVVDAGRLRLRERPGPGERWANARKDAKVLELGSRSVWRSGTGPLRRALQPGAPPPQPGRLVLRPDEFVRALKPGEFFFWNATRGQHFELEADGVEPVLVAVQRDGEIICAVQNGQVSVLKTGALVKALAGGGEAPGWRDVRERAREVCRRPFEGRPEDAEYFCGPQHDHRFYVTSRYDNTEAHAQKVLEANLKQQAKQIEEQPRGLKRFTAEGFAVRPGPWEVIEKVRSFYLEHRLKQSHPEVGNIFNPTLAMYESDVWALELPAELRSALDAELRPLVAEWASLSPDGFRPLIVHGPRLYHNGSILREHVDNLDTHAFGVIVHLGHEGLGSQGEAVSWPFSIVDHAGTTHTLPAADSGEVVFYEAATCRHWREGPFIGREFANLFLHYAPQGWPQAFRAQADVQEL